MNVSCRFTLIQSQYGQGNSVRTKLGVTQYWPIGVRFSDCTPETIDELIDTNPKCRLFSTIDLEEYLAALICLSADEICQPFSWGGNFYVDSGIHLTELWFKTSMSKLHSKIGNGSYILICPYWENLQDSTPPPLYLPCIYACKADRNGGGRGPSERRLERQQFTKWVKNTNMRECISSLWNLLKTCRKLHFQVNFTEKPTLKVFCLYSSIVSAVHYYELARNQCFLPS